MHYKGELMNRDQFLQDFDALPPFAQQEVVDFVAFLRTRYPTTETESTFSLTPLSPDDLKREQLREMRQRLEGNTAFGEDVGESAAAAHDVNFRLKYTDSEDDAERVRNRQNVAAGRGGRG